MGRGGFETRGLRLLVREVGKEYVSRRRFSTGEEGELKRKNKNATDLRVNGTCDFLKKMSGTQSFGYGSSKD